MHSFRIVLGFLWLVPSAGWTQPSREPDPRLQAGRQLQGQGEKAREQLQLTQAAHCFAQAAEAYQRAGEPRLAAAASQEVERLLPLTKQTIAVKAHITLLAVDRAEKQLVLVNSTNEVLVWNLEKGSVKHTLNIPIEKDDYLHWIGDAACTGDGSRLAVAGGRRLFQVWDLTTGMQLPGFGKVPYDADSVSFSPDDRYLIASGKDFVQVWESRSGKTVKLVDRLAKDNPWPRWPARRFDRVVPAPDAKRLLSFGADGAALLDMEKGPLLNLDRAAFLRDQIHFTPDGTKVVAAGRDGRVLVWDARDGKQLFVLEAKGKAEQPKIARLLLTRDQRCLVVPASSDDPARLWDLTKGTVLRDYPAPANQALAFNAEETVFFSAGPKTVGVWETATGKRRWYDWSPGVLMTKARFVDQGRKIIVWDEAAWRLPLKYSTTTVCAWAALNGRLLHKGSLPAGTDRVRVLDNGLCLMDRYVTASNPSHTVLQFRPAEAIRAETVEFPSLTLSADLPIRGVQCSPDEKFLAVWGNDAALQLWDLEGKVIRTFKARGDIRGALFTGNNGVAAWSKDNVVHHWDVESGKEHRLDLGAVVRGVRANGAGTRLLTWDEDYDIAWWDLTTGKRLHSFAHTRSILGVALDPARETALSWSLDGTARIWDLNKGRERVALAHEGAVEFAAWGPDGQVLTCQGSRVRIWKEGVAQPTHELNQTGVEGAQWSRDGKKVLTWGWEGDVKWWTLAPQPAFKAFKAWHGGTGGAMRAWLLQEETRILIVDTENRATLWEVDSGEWIADYPDPRKSWLSNVNSGYRDRSVGEAIGVSPDGRLILRGEVGVSIWDGKTGKLLAKVPRTASIRGVQFLQGNSRILVWGGSFDVDLWDLSRVTRQDTRSEQLLLRLELQTGQRLNQAGRLVPLSNRELREREVSMRKFGFPGMKMED